MSELDTIKSDDIHRCPILFLHLVEINSAISSTEIDIIDTKFVVINGAQDELLAALRIHSGSGDSGTRPRLEGRETSFLCAYNAKENGRRVELD